MIVIAILVGETQTGGWGGDPSAPPLLYETLNMYRYIYIYIYNIRSTRALLSGDGVRYLGYCNILCFVNQGPNETSMYGGCVIFWTN